MNYAKIEADLHRYDSEESGDDTKPRIGLELVKADERADNESLTYTQLTDIDTGFRTYFDSREKIKPYEERPANFWRSNKREYFQHLDDVNKGVKNGPTWRNGRYDTYRTNWNHINIIAEQLGLTQQEREVAEEYFLHICLENWGLLKELIAVSVCLYVVHSDEQDKRKCHPNTSVENKDKIFYEALNKFGLRKKDVEKTYFKVQNYSLSKARAGMVYIPPSLHMGKGSPGESASDSNAPEKRSERPFRDWSSIRGTSYSKNGLNGAT